MMNVTCDIRFAAAVIYNNNVRVGQLKRTTILRLVCGTYALITEMLGSYP